MLNDQVLHFLALAYTLKRHGVHAWVDHYDEGEDDERVVKILLPLIGCAILACVISCYVKKHCNKDDEDDKKKKQDEDDDAEAQRKSANNFAAKRAASSKVMPPTDKTHIPPYKQNQTQRGSVSSDKVMLHHQSIKQAEGRTMSQNSAHSSGAGSSGYQSNPSSKALAEKQIITAAPSTIKRPSLVSTVSRDTKPRVLNNPNSISKSASQKYPPKPASTVSRAQSTVDKTSSVAGSVYAEISTPSCRAPAAATLASQYSHDTQSKLARREWNHDEWHDRSHSSHHRNKNTASECSKENF